MMEEMIEIIETERGNRRTKKDREFAEKAMEIARA